MYPACSFYPTRETLPLCLWDSEIRYAIPKAAPANRQLLMDREESDYPDSSAVGAEAFGYRDESGIPKEVQENRFEYRIRAEHIYACLLQAELPGGKCLSYYLQLPGLLDVNVQSLSNLYIVVELQFKYSFPRYARIPIKTPEGERVFVAGGTASIGIIKKMLAGFFKGMLASYVPPRETKIRTKVLPLKRDAVFRNFWALPFLSELL